MNKGQDKKGIEVLSRFNEYKDFIKDKRIEFVIKKVERVVCVVYMMCEFVPQTETLNSDLKKTTHSLLEAVSSFPQLSGVTTSAELAHSKLQHLSALLSLTFISGYISESNVEILKSEINYLHKHIEDLAQTSVSDREQNQIKSNLFVVNQTHSQSSNHKSSSKDSPVIKDKNIATVIRSNRVKNIKDNIRSNSTQKPSQSASSDVSKEDREERVISVIRDKGVVSIKDISSVIFDVSEKTIQRTLQTLIDKGQIKKEGERRWAKYALV